MSEQMEFPETFERFAKEYGFKDDKEVYTNGSDLIPIFRVKQWLEHDNKLRAIETDTAYECGKAVLNKIRAEIADWQTDIHDNEYDAEEHDFVFERIFEIIDEYREE